MGYSRQQQGTFPQISDDILKKIIIGGDAVESAKLTVEYGEKVGKAMVDDRVTTTQVRAIFTTVRSIEAEWSRNANAQQTQKSLREFILLKSKLRYQAVRDTKLQNFVELLNRGIDLVKDRDHFQRFVDFFEAILAYHKVTGGKN